MPSSLGYVDDQLTGCDCFMIYTVNELYHVISREALYPAESACCLINPAARLRQRGVSVVLAGNPDSVHLHRMMGAGLEVIRDFRGQCDTVVESYLSALAVENGFCGSCRISEKENPLNN